ncbi:MAG: hypothetical protein ACE5I3_06030 [Phycisphaerae bacterium]
MLEFLNSLFAILLLAGCAHVPNQWTEDGPATTAEWDSPTAKDLRANYAPGEQRHRDWDVAAFAAESGAVTHWPPYFEDPFADQGPGREGLNKYHIDWEDYVALPYGYARFTLNWLMLPASAVVTPPWTLMESDGRISRQALGYDHDATRADSVVSEPVRTGRADDEKDTEQQEAVEGVES